MSNSELNSEQNSNFGAELTNEQKLVSLQEAVQQYQHVIETLQNERNDYLARLQRTCADFENYKKRAKKDNELAAQDVLRKLLEKLMPVMDNVDYALSAIEDYNIKDYEFSAVEPLRMIKEAFLKILSDYAIVRIEPKIDEIFNPEMHHAVSAVPGDVTNQIKHVLRAGYIINGQVFRPSDVVVVR